MSNTLGVAEAAPTSAEAKSDSARPPSRRHYQSISSVPSNGTDLYLLPHLSITPASSTTSSDTPPETIVFIHGAFSSHHTYIANANSPHLASYHILIPDLHCSGTDTSLGIRPFSRTRVAALIAHLIEQRAHGGRAHLVGLSLGAHISISVATLHPEVVREKAVVVSGYNRFQAPTWVRPVVPYFFYGLIKGPKLMPQNWVKSAMNYNEQESAPSHDEKSNGDDPSTVGEPQGICTLSLTRELLGPVFGFGNPDEQAADVYVSDEGLPGRICVICATKGNWYLPSDDKIPHAKMLFEKIKGRKGVNGEGKLLVQNREMRHPWNEQDPELFAEFARAWIERGKLPDGFESC